MSKEIEGSMFIVTDLARNQPVQVFGTETNLELNWAEGMIGVLPVFNNVQDAIKYASDNAQIFECVVVNQPEEQNGKD